MKTVITCVGEFHDERVTWPADWPPPREYETVQLSNGVHQHVRSVSWYPYGEDGSEPFVYVVLGPRRLS